MLFFFFSNKYMHSYASKNSPKSQKWINTMVVLMPKIWKFKDPLMAHSSSLGADTSAKRDHKILILDVLNKQVVKAQIPIEGAI